MKKINFKITSIIPPSVSIKKEIKKVKNLFDFANFSEFVIEKSGTNFRIIGIHKITNTKIQYSKKEIIFIGLDNYQGILIELNLKESDVFYLFKQNVLIIINNKILLQQLEKNEFLRIRIKEDKCEMQEHPFGCLVDFF